MVGSVNKVILVGNLGRDPERCVPCRMAERICNLSVATSERWKDRNSGEQQERTEWHRVVVFDDRLVDVCERFLSKGRKVYLERVADPQMDRSIGTESIFDRGRLRRFRGQLVLLDSRSEGGGGGYDAPSDYGMPDSSGGGMGGVRRWAPRVMTWMMKSHSKT